MSENRKLLEMNVPMWFDGKSINEALFCEDFLRTRQIIFANGAFFTPDGRVTDDLPLRGEIFEELKYCAVNNIPRKISNIIEIMKLAAHVEDFPPEQDRIHLANGTLMLDGTFTEGKPDIVRNRLPVFYRPDTPKPVLWLSFLNGLLYPEDIPTLQEFIGYCLIPSNKGQRMIFLWAFEGLQRLVANNFKFTESERTKTNRESVKRDNNNIFDFMESEGYIRLKADASISSKELYEIYRMWCEENSLPPLKSRSFSDSVVANLSRYNLEHTNKITNSAGRRVWGFMGIEAVARPNINGFYDVSPCTYVPEEWRD